jgi:hypothetical protein
MALERVPPSGARSGASGGVTSLPTTALCRAYFKFGQRAEFGASAVAFSPLGQMAVQDECLAVGIPRVPELVPDYSDRA